MAKDKRLGKAKTAQASQPAGAITTKSTQPPSWPPFKPPLPVTDLELESIVKDKVVVLRSFFPRFLCRDYVSFLGTLPLTTTPGKPKRGMALRVNDRFQIEDSAFAHRLWSETGLKEALTQTDMTSLWGGELVGLNPNIRVYRYLKGHFFDAHYDDSNNVTVTTLDEGQGQLQRQAKTTWTLLLYLTSSSEGCVGGETVFYPHDRRSAKEEIAVSLETGMCLLHKHGDDCMLHEGREVLAGEKWILRTDLCVKR